MNWVRFVTPGGKTQCNQENKLRMMQSVILTMTFSPPPRFCFKKFKHVSILRLMSNILTVQSCTCSVIKVPVWLDICEQVHQHWLHSRVAAKNGEKFCKRCLPQSLPISRIRSCLVANSKGFNNSKLCLCTSAPCRYKPVGTIDIAVKRSCLRLSHISAAVTFSAVSVISKHSWAEPLQSCCEWLRAL